MARPRKSVTPSSSTTEANTPTVSAPTVPQSTASSIVDNGRPIRVASHPKSGVTISPEDVDKLLDDAMNVTFGETDATTEAVETEVEETEEAGLPETAEIIEETPQAPSPPVVRKPTKTWTQDDFEQALAKMQSTFSRRENDLIVQLREQQKTQEQRIEQGLQAQEQAWLQEMDAIGQGDETKVLINKARELRSREAALKQSEASIGQLIIPLATQRFIDNAQKQYGVALDPQDFAGVAPEHLLGFGMHLVGLKQKEIIENTKAQIQETQTAPMNVVSPVSQASSPGLTTQRIASMSRKDVAKRADDILDAMMRGKLK